MNEKKIKYIEKQLAKFNKILKIYQEILERTMLFFIPNNDDFGMSSFPRKELAFGKA